MSNRKISELNTASPVVGTELLPIVQGGETKKIAVQDLRPYKVFTALLTQSGGDDLQDIFEGSLTIGVTYRIFDEGGIGYDFTNVGAPNNNDGTYFTATGTTPANWPEGVGLLFNTGAPVATVLENTIGNVWFTYDDVGVYVGNKAEGFSANKTSVSNSLVSCSAPLLICSGTVVDPSVVYINSIDLTYEPVEMESTILIEIRVYN
jgi:hypothetical protein